MNHRFRKDKNSFYNNDIELGKLQPLPKMTDQLEGILNLYKKEDLKARKQHNFNKEKHELWKKKSIFYELPYWETNTIQHNLDMMHIVKNVSDNILWTILGCPMRSKDNVMVRRDLEMLNIRKPLHPISLPSGRWSLPPASYTMSSVNTMSSVDKDYFCRMLKKVRPLDGYSIAARRSFPKNVVDVLIEVVNFFRQLCSRINKKSDLEQMQGRIPLTLCHLERIFPPAFFDVMEHLPIDLASDALVAGCVSFRSMWPIERYLYTLKQYVRNQARPEGSIVSGYLIEECMHFCERYLKDVDTKLNHEPRNDDGESTIGRPLGQCTLKQQDRRTWNQAHKWVLDNYESLE
ncbi:hypothetical protein LIER_02064 [Lithospermum erythrorhizon]|uniref:DUF4218 domain-containing protein n=1 Tax=Lithospermum erythrorhizon TaxID=34254 RepID=A0AAV3NPC4_LITER